VNAFDFRMDGESDMSIFSLHDGVVGVAQQAISCQ